MSLVRLKVVKREKMAKLREEIAVQKAKETELNKTIHITEETMRAKQMLATMSHEIRSPLTGVVSMAEILANTKLDQEQRQLLDVMLSSGDLVLQLINDILDLSKVESGVMKLEATKFRPREVVKHVLQTAAASLQKDLTLEGHVSDDVPVEITGDVLRIRQILTNLISNAIKFTHEGKVGINLRVVSENSRHGNGHQSAFLAEEPIEENSSIAPQSSCSPKLVHIQTHDKDHDQNVTSDGGPSIAPQSSCSPELAHIQTFDKDHDQYVTSDDGPAASTKMETFTEEEREKDHHSHEIIVWLCCDVYDTGIGIPENALPTLFKKYMQVSADHARKYGGTGLGLAICKQLVELMGGHLTVTSREHCGSTFTFLLPCKVTPKREHSVDTDELSNMADQEAVSDAISDETNVGHFYFQPRAMGSLLSSGGCMTRSKSLTSSNHAFSPLNKLNLLSEKPYSFPSNNCISRELALLEDACSISDATDTLELDNSSRPDTDSDAENLSGRGVRHNVAGNGLVMNRYHGPNTDHKIIPGSRDPLHCTKKCADITDTAKNTSEGERTCQSHTHENPVGGHSTHGSILELSEFVHEPKILLVEDNKINVMVTQSMMKQIGHKIDVVNNGLEAVLAVQSNNYDLILMDVCMPVMDGLQATRLIRSFEENGNWDAAIAAGINLPTVSSDSSSDGLTLMHCRKRVSIIAMTANALAESAAECLANGMDSFVSKPVTFQKLKHCLQQYLPS